jgi:tape measure domain-containing protein
MAEEVGGIVYEVGMEVSGLTAGAKQAEDALDSIDKSAQDSSKSLGKLDNSSRNAGKGMGSATGSANSLKTSLTALAGAISVSLVMQWGSAFLEVADNMTQLQARIARLSTDAATAKQTFSDIAAISSRTGSSISDTTKLWETLTSSLKEAGATNAQVLSLTDTLQKIGRIGGSSTEEMANALRQFGQSIASGTIRAEEFNSILEQMPELARQIASGLGISMGELRQRMLEGKLTAQDALNAIQDRTSQINSEFSKLPRTMSQATNSLEVSFATLVAAINNATGASTTMVSIVDSLTSALDRLQGKAMTTSQQIADLTSTGEMYARRARTWSWLGVDGWAAQNTGLARAAGLAVDLTGDMQKVAAATGKAADATKHLTIPQAQTKEADKMILSLEEQNQLLKIQDERQRAVTKARLEAQKVTDNPNKIARAGELAGQIYDLTEAEKAREKAQNNSQSSAKKAATEQENIANKLEQLRQKSLLTAESTRELSREQSILAAQQSLGKGATQEQINLAGQYAAKAWDNANALKAQAEAEKQRVEAVKGFSALKSQTSPMFAVETNYQKDLAALNAYAVAYPQKIAEVEQARAAIEEQYRQQRLDAMWQEWSQQNAATQAAAAAFDAFGQTASNALTGVLTGSMSVSDALQSIGSTVLNAVINSFVQMGVEWLKSVIMGQVGMTAASGMAAAQAQVIAAAMAPAAAMTSLATSGANAIPAQAGIASTVGVAKAMSVAGALKNGGPAQAGAMYQVGENNLPEIFQASNGNQYMIPGDNGKVISNKDLTGGGSGIIIYNNVTNNSSGATASSTARDNGDGSVTIETIVADIENGGPISQAITSNTTATRRATE